MANKMLKTIIASALFVSSFSVMAANNEVKTSSLAIQKSAISSKALPTQCQKMFSQADKLISEAEKQPGTHPQMKKIKNTVSSAKKQILAMDLEMQQKSCDKGLVALNNMLSETRN